MRLAVLLSALALTLPAVTPPANTPPAKPAAAAKPAPKPGPRPDAAADAAIEKLLNAKLAASKIAVDKFTAQVQGGTAFLTGRTNVIQHKGVATRLAKSAGATKVVNNIEVSEEARQAAAERLAQGRTREQLKRGESPAPRSQRATVR